MPDLSPILATKLDVLRNNEMPGAKLFLFKEGSTSDRSLVTITFDPAKPAGQVLRGWRINPRRFDRFGTPFLELQIARTKKYTAESLAPVRGFAVMRRGETTATIQRCEPVGVAALATEPVWKFAATGRTSQVHDITPLADLFGLEDGSGYFELEDGTGNIGLEA